MNPQTITIELAFRNQNFDVMIPTAVTINRLKILLREALVLKEIHCPTLILGALEDDVVGVDGSKELAKAISGCQLLILKHSGHALYEENKVFQEAVCEFLN